MLSKRSGETVARPWRDRGEIVARSRRGCLHELREGEVRSRLGGGKVVLQRRAPRRDRAPLKHLVQ